MGISNHRLRSLGKRLCLLAAMMLWIGGPGSNARAADAVVEVNGGAIAVEFTAPVGEATKDALLAWIRNAARAVAEYYGTFPARRVVLRITPVDGRRVKGGRSFGFNGPLIKISVGRDATATELASDWMLPHEFLHVGFPDLADKHHWLEEGLATYIEPIARARSGLLSPAQAWSDLVNGLPQGQPEEGDKGLDNTPTWGRTYWGGALFCLRADVEIRRRTANRQGLEHAMRAIVAAGGTIGNSWTMDRVIRVGDGATGVPVLRELYDEMKDRAVTVDLATLWKQLGIVRRGRSVAFDDGAPLASIRKAITGER
jgi:hypothetical protein